MPSASQPEVLSSSVVTTQGNQHHLIVGGASGAAPRGDQQRVGPRAIGYGGRVLLQADLRAVRSRRRRCWRGCCRRCRPPKSPSPAAIAASQSGAAVSMPVAALAVCDDAGHLDLVHRVDHRRRAAGLRERVAGRGKLREALPWPPSDVGTNRLNRLSRRKATKVSSGAAFARSTVSAFAAAILQTAATAVSRPVYMFMPRRDGRPGS